MKITCQEAVLAVRAIGRSTTAKDIAAHMGTSPGAVATALRKATQDGRVELSWPKGIGLYRFKRLYAITPKEQAT